MFCCHVYYATEGLWIGGQDRRAQMFIAKQTPEGELWFRAVDDSLNIGERFSSESSKSEL